MLCYMENYSPDSKSMAFFKYIFSVAITAKKKSQYGSWRIKVIAVLWKSDDSTWQPHRLHCKTDDLVQEFNENSFAYNLKIEI